MSPLTRSLNRCLQNGASPLALALLLACDPTAPGVDAGSDPRADASASDASGDVRLRDTPPRCASDDDCEDGDPDTLHACQVFLGFCYEVECRTDAHCNDDNPCTLDYCLTDSCGHGSANCCEGEADCFDGNDCTSDACGGDSLCHWERLPLPGCFACPDRDGDGSGDTWCGGTDCDDRDPSRSADHAEVCTNGIDDDCDGAIDTLDASCRPATATCPGTPIVLGDAVEGSTVTLSSTGTTSGCGGSAFYTFTLASTSDVEVRVHLEEPMPVAPCPDCPIPEVQPLNYRAYLEPSCGATTEDLFGGGGCNYWDPDGGAFGGSQETRYARRRVPAGTYTLEIQAGEMFGWRDSVTDFTVTATATPSASATCDGTALLAGGSVRGSTDGHPDAFGTSCAGVSVVSPESLHPFTLTTRSRVRLQVTPDELSPGSSPRARLAIVGSCDATADRVGCTESSGSSCQATASLDQILEAGTYQALVEARDGGALTYALALEVEPASAVCVGAPSISSSGMTSGTTVGASDDFRDARVCGSGMGPDVVHTLVLTARSRVVLDLIASYERPLLKVFTGCGESSVGSSTSTPRLDLTLDAGTYSVVLDGERAGDAGAFVLSTTILAL